MIELEVRPQHADWVVVEDHEPLSLHATADAAVRAARVVLAREDDAELVVLDRYARVVAVVPPRHRGAL